MTARRRPVPQPVKAWPSGRPVRSGRFRRVLGRLWANRPTLGTLAYLLAVPGIVNLALGWPLWWVAAGQWSLWLVLMMAMSFVEARHPAPSAGHERIDGAGGHDVPPHFGARAAGAGEEADR
ncbi:hypothetical protein ACIBF1_15580 [Spirillospora sp. NPDC050679]